VVYPERRQRVAADAPSVPWRRPRAPSPPDPSQRPCVSCLFKCRDKKWDGCYSFFQTVYLPGIFQVRIFQPTPVKSSQRSRPPFSHIVFSLADTTTAAVGSDRPGAAWGAALRGFFRCGLNATALARLAAHPDVASIAEDTHGPKGPRG